MADVRWRSCRGNACGRQPCGEGNRVGPAWRRSSRARSFADLSAVGITDRERKAYAVRNTWSRNATDWPELLPPFDTPTSLFASPEGWLVVRRVASADEPETRYDVIDKSGTRRTQLVLRTNEHILGFGQRSVYVVETDADGIQRLRRHPWPAVAGAP